MPSRDASRDSLHALSPLDGRYHSLTEGVASHFSEAALIRARVQVEAHWLMHLAALKANPLSLTVSASVGTTLKTLATQGISAQDLAQIKDLEQTTRHDVKAVEYFLRERLRSAGAGPDVLAAIHFAATSEDVNNLSYGLNLRSWHAETLLPALRKILAQMADIANAYAATPMMARTHGQPASPTTMGKEFANFHARLTRQLRGLEAAEFLGKMNGAVGNYNAHHAAFPKLDWPTICADFVTSRLGLSWNPLTTQIESHDAVVELCHRVHHVNSILIGFARDIWGYISLGYIKQRTRPGEVGSSTMPHKVNPIDFENAEGNLGLANALFTHFGDKLPISRWQRDLTDSTTLRNLGVAFGHCLIAYQNLSLGLGKIDVAVENLAEDLDSNWELLAEPIQTVLRKHHIVDAYERLKDFTRGKSITRASLHAFIDAQIELTADVKEELKTLTPKTYIGLAPELTRRYLEGVKP